MHRAIAIAILMGLPLSAAVADVFRSVDAQGHVQYSDTPTPGAQLVRMDGPARADAGAAQHASEHQVAHRGAKWRSDPSATRAGSRRARGAEPGRPDARRAVQEGHGDLQPVGAGAAHLSTGPDGERQYLSDDDAEKSRVARQSGDGRGLQGPVKSRQAQRARSPLPAASLPGREDPRRHRILYSSLHAHRLRQDAWPRQ